jgi:hypothetical protein
VCCVGCVVVEIGVDVVCVLCALCDVGMLVLVLRVGVDCCW